MRIVVVTPWSPSARRPRSMGLIEHLAQSHEVHVVGASWSRAEDHEYEQLKVASIQIVRLSKVTALLRAILGLVVGRSLQQAYLDSPSFRRAIKVRISALAPELLYFNVIRTAHLAYTDNPTAKILDIDEFRSSYYEQMANTSRSYFWRIVAKTESRRLKEAEHRAVTEFDACIVSSPADLDRSRPTTHLVRSPHALTQTSDRGTIDRASNSLLFVGRLDYRANYEALTWFVRAVLPQVVARAPGTVLRVVGADAGRPVLDLASRDVHIIGAVSDVTDSYRSATISIVPITMATGVQMKLIESLVTGVPTVVTPRVAEGAGVTNRLQTIVAESAEEWAAAIVELLEHSQLRGDLSEEGIQWAHAMYDHDQIYKELDRVLEIVMTRTGTSFS